MRMGKFPWSDGADADMHSRDAYSGKGCGAGSTLRAEDRWSEPEKILDVEVLSWPARRSSHPSWRARLGRQACRGRAPTTAGLVGPRAARLLQHGHGLSESCPGCRAMKLGLRAQGRSLPCRARMEALGRSESGKRRLDIAVDRTKDVIGEMATKRAMLSNSKLGVGEAPPSPMSSSGAASSSSKTSESASSQRDGGR